MNHRMISIFLGGIVLCAVACTKKPTAETRQAIAAMDAAWKKCSETSNQWYAGVRVLQESCVASCERMEQDSALIMIKGNTRLDSLKLVCKEDQLKLNDLVTIWNDFNVRWMEDSRSFEEWMLMLDKGQLTEEEAKIQMQDHQSKLNSAITFSDKIREEFEGERSKYSADVENSRILCDELLMKKK